MQGISSIHKHRWLIVSILACFIPYLICQEGKPPNPAFKVNVDTIFLKVTVTDSSNRYITGIKQSDFRVYEDGVLQTLSHFSQEQAPISMGFVMDVSYSMEHTRSWRTAKDWFTKVVERDQLHPDDEYFLITFNQKVRLVRSFTEELDELEKEITLQLPDGNTALLDAIYWGIHLSEEARHDKKALILITDGDDNNSRYSRPEVRELASESDVQIYILPTRPYGNYFFEQLADLTGGRVLDFRYMGDYFELIHLELRNQYTLGYIPSNKKRDGEWRKITVKLDTPPGFPKLSVRTKSGYFAPDN